MKNLESYLESSEIPGCKCKMWRECNSITNVWYNLTESGWGKAK